MITLVLNTSTDRTGQSTRGSKFYELSNHLGNVLATVSDMKLGYVTSLGQTTAQGYKAQVQSASDYFPFGWAMSGRQYSAGEYRFGFNGKENDTHWGDQLIQDYGFRIYNPSIGKFLSVDPLTRDYPMLTPYQFASNTPIQAVDLDGLEAWIIIEDVGVGVGHVSLLVVSNDRVVNYSFGRYAGGNWYTLWTTGPGILNKFEGQDALEYTAKEIFRYEGNAFKIEDVNPVELMRIMDDLWNSGTPPPESAPPKTQEIGKEVAIYWLGGQNCATTTCNAVKRAGTEAFDETSTIMGVELYDYDEDFVIPGSLNDYLLEKSKTSDLITNDTEGWRSFLENIYETKLKGNTSGEASGSSGESSGSSANTSSSSPSSSGNNSGSASSSDEDPQ